MVKRKLTLLLLILSLLNLVFYVNVNTATTQNYIPRKVDFDRSGVPKNILVGSYAGGRSHVKPMLDVAAILIERGYNVRFFFFTRRVSDRSSYKFSNLSLFIFSMYR
jgi:hypothetical protein